MCQTAVSSCLELCRGPPKDFEITFVLNNGRNKFSFSCPCGLRYFSTQESKILNLTLESGEISNPRATEGESIYIYIALYVK